jgi:hypothetical protein
MAGGRMKATIIEKDDSMLVLRPQDNSGNLVFVYAERRSCASEEVASVQENAERRLWKIT